MSVVVEVGGPEVNKFEQVSSEGQQTSLVGGGRGCSMSGVSGAGGRRL